MASCRPTPRWTRWWARARRQVRKWPGAGEHAGVPQSGIGQHRLQAGGASGRRDGDRTVPARAGEAGQRSFARLLGGGYLQCGGRDGAAIGDPNEDRGHVALQAGLSRTLCPEPGGACLPGAESTAGCATACCAPVSPRTADFVAPEPATDDDVRLVHDADWVAKLRTGTLSYSGHPAARDSVFAADGGGVLAGGRRQHAGGAPGVARRRRLQRRRRFPSRLPGARRRLLRHQRYRDRGAAPAGGRRDPPRDGRRLRRPPRQRHGGDLRGRSIGLHALHSPVQQLSFEKPLSSLDIHLPDGIGDSRIPAAPGQRVSRGVRSCSSRNW